MVVYHLHVKADLENVSKVEFPEQWSLTVEQDGSNERREVIVDPSNEEEISGSRGTCNFKVKFPGAKKESYMNVQEPPKKGGQTFLSGNDYVVVVAFECRGLSVVDWNVKDGSFKCHTESGKVFDDVTFEDGDWYDYDDEADMSVGVTNIEYKIERA
mmetsp:Transcript_1350/g.2144  ORF Transcript_1350/g.2144 Transcript_1350/m.2144 type:complete len:157 (+) Transcript_1350:67-537(+)